jgi:hypothetical protein
LLASDSAHAIGTSIALWGSQILRQASRFRVLRYDHPSWRVRGVYRPNAIEDLGRNPCECLTALSRAIDTWTTLEGPKKLFSDPKLAAEFGRLFEGMPEITFWGASGWESFSDV